MSWTLGSLLIGGTCRSSVSLSLDKYVMAMGLSALKTEYVILKYRVSMNHADLEEKGGGPEVSEACYLLDDYIPLE